MSETPTFPAFFPSHVAVRASLEKFTCALCCAALFFLPFSHYLVNKFVAASAIFIAISGDYRKKWAKISQHTSLRCLFIFLLFLLLAAFYSSAPLNKALSMYAKFGRLFFIYFLIHILSDDSIRKTAGVVFVAGVATATLFSYAFHFNWLDFSFTQHYKLLIPSSPSGYTIFINIINLSVLEASAIYLLLTAFLTGFARTRLRQCGLLLAFLLIGIDLFFFNGERTGCLMVLLLVPLALIQYLKPGVKKNYALVLAMSLLVVIIASSGRLAHKVNLLAYSLTHRAAQTTHLTAAGYRIAFAKYSGEIIKEHPLLGSGMGSFAQKYNEVGGPLLPNKKYLAEPHNAFINVTVQAGIVGLSLLLYFLYYLWKDTVTKGESVQKLGTAIFLIFIVNSLCNESLVGNTTGFLYVFAFSLLLGYPRRVECK